MMSSVSERPISWCRGGECIWCMYVHIQTHPGHVSNCLKRLNADFQQPLCESCVCLGYSLIVLVSVIVWGALWWCFQGRSMLSHRPRQKESIQNFIGFSEIIKYPETHGQARAHLHWFKRGGEHNPRNRRWIEGTAHGSLGDRMVSRGAAHGRLGCGSRSARSAQHVRIARHNIIIISLVVEWELGFGSRGTRSAWHVRIVGHNMISLMVECDLGFGSRSTTHSR